MLIIFEGRAPSLENLDIENGLNGLFLFPIVFWLGNIYRISGSKIDGLFWFNTFSIPEYAKLEEPCPAISLQQSDRFKRFHWLYWQIYRMHIDESAYQKLFQRDLMKDFGGIIRLMELGKWGVKTAYGWKMTERGAIWAHQLQMLFSLTYIDDVWTACQKEPWPEEIVLQ